ncbi:MAG: hypothetical protein ABI625_12870 [bacterium]
MAVLTVVVSGTGLAQATTVTPILRQSGPTDEVPVRQLPAPNATSVESFGSLAAVRHLPTGNVLVNDQGRRRLLLLDKELKLIRVVADTTLGTGKAYGEQPAGLLAYRADSTLLVEPASMSMLVIDQDGTIVRTMSVPRPKDVLFLTGGALGNPGFDGRDRLVYRAPPDLGGTRPPRLGETPTALTPPDSAAIVRFDLAMRRLDTAGFVKIPKTNISLTPDENGRMRVSVAVDPLPVVDDWVVLSDGSVAFIRGRDYHVDFITEDGPLNRAELIPYDWQRMTDDDKVRFLDSAKVIRERQRVATAGTSNTASGGRLEPLTWVSASELPDYKPVFGTASIRADMDAQIWVRTIATKVRTGGAMHDVIDKRGKLVDRIQTPVATTIVGFGPGRVVYLGFRDSSGVHLQRAAAR